MKCKHCGKNDTETLRAKDGSLMEGYVEPYCEECKNE